MRKTRIRKLRDEFKKVMGRPPRKTHNLGGGEYIPSEIRRLRKAHYAARHGISLWFSDIHV